LPRRLDGTAEPRPVEGFARHAPRIATVARPAAQSICDASHMSQLVPDSRDGRKVPGSSRPTVSSATPARSADRALVRFAPPRVVFTVRPGRIRSTGSRAAHLALYASSAC
jgi:hypothetical protein